MEFQRRYGFQTTLRFVVLKAGSRDFAATGDWTPATGDTKISKDGGNVANTTNNPTAVGGTGSILWELTLTATEMQATEVDVQIVDSATKAIEDQALIVSTRLSAQVAASRGVIVGEVDDATESPTTTTFEALRIAPNGTEETTADHYNGRTLLFVSGALQGQQTDITDYVLQNSKERYTVTALTEAPADGDNFVVL